jgi:MFS family permease
VLTLKVIQSQFGGLWRNPDFMKLWIGQTISEFGSRITRDGLPLAAVIILSATPTQMGLLAMVGAAPVLLIGLVAGVWVDRLRRRPILIAADIGRTLLLLSIPLAAIYSVLHIEQLYVIAALTGILTVFFDVAYQSYLPALVKREHILEGNSKLGLSGAAAEIGGPALAGALIQIITAPIAILFDALSFLFSALFVGLIRKHEPALAPPTQQPHMRREVVEGLRVVLRNPLLRALAGRAATGSFFGAFFGTLYGLYAIRVLQMGPAALGVTIAAGGVGDLVGALFAQRIVRRCGLGVTFIATALVGGVAGLLIPLAAGPPLVAVALMVVAQLVGDMAGSIYAINEVSLRQAITPDHVLGRVNASVQFMTMGVYPLGALVGGVLGSAIGARATLLVAALGGLLSCLWLLGTPVRTLRAHPTPVLSASVP